MVETMSLQDWAKKGWLRTHKPTQQEIADLLEIVERDLKDARTDRLSADWQFGIAYNAALKLGTVLLHASGYRPEKTLQHYRTLAALPLILGAERKADAAYLDACRIKRNTVEYDTAGAATRKDAEELIEFATQLYKDALNWLKQKRPELVP
jgi:uncharacterized protein (UPF0332 family)